MWSAEAKCPMKPLSTHAANDFESAATCVGVTQITLLHTHMKNQVKAVTPPQGAEVVVVFEQLLADAAAAAQRPVQKVTPLAVRRSSMRL